MQEKHENVFIFPEKLIFLEKFFALKEKRVQIEHAIHTFELVKKHKLVKSLIRKCLLTLMHTN